MPEDTAAEYTGRHRKTPDYSSAAEIDAALNLAEVNAHLAQLAEG